ncbi:MAG: UDP-2,3-diacylglucosamine diphosphatase [Paludibacteraceae bacterium]|nr:UDP-2,3-diacylglucosamine diphosphatase [Paludibacteraceae bacterium]
MIYFLSDAHLGSGAIENGTEHQQRVVDLLNQMGKDATAIYLLGDIFDFWYEYLWDAQCTMHNAQCTVPKSKQQFKPILDCLKGLTAKGIEVHYFIGNHDIWTFGWLEKYTGVTVHKEPCSVTLYGKNCYLAHGDGLGPKWLTVGNAQCTVDNGASEHSDKYTISKEDKKRIRAFMRLRAFFHHPIPQFLYRLLPPCVGDKFGYEWARRSRLKELANPCPYKGEDKEELVLFAKEQENGIRTANADGTRDKEHHDYYIFGHRHIELDLMITPHARVIILGDLFKLWTYAAMNEQGELQLCIHEKNN